MSIPFDVKARLERSSSDYGDTALFVLNRIMPGALAHFFPVLHSSLAGLCCSAAVFIRAGNSLM